ncbi:MAG TPA: hypothetical protein VFO94_06300 [Gammaproteobacteria bacterium]|nr:hypothetical protein [Gammaproteobacteria bacterium]
MNAEHLAVHFFICVADEAGDDLQKGKVYIVLPDTAAERDGFLRVVDDSGEDYLYPAACFMSVSLPRDVEGVLLSSRKQAHAR